MRNASIKLVLVLALTGVWAPPAGCNRPVHQPVPEMIPVAPTGLASATFPLRKQSSQRCLVDQAGRPFLLHGEAAWTLLVQLTREEAERYLDDRQRRGFNTLLVDLLEVDLQAYGISGAKSPRNAYGETPFVVPGDYTRPNEKYFAHVDWVLARAAERGFLVLLTPSYLGYEGGNQGWYGVMQDNGTERLQAYGRYLGLRYRNLTNIVWVHGGDYNPPERELMQAVIDGLRETNPDALHSFHGSRGTAARAFVGEKANWLDINTIYTDGNGIVAAARTEYNASSLPFILIEAFYEGRVPGKTKDKSISEAVVRAQAYQAMLSGACGQLMGNWQVFMFVRWTDALDSPGTRSMSHLRALLKELEWWRLKPVYDGFIVDGIGEGALRAVSGATEDNKRAVVYIPELRDITLNTTSLSGPYIEARWIDPTNSRSVTVTGSPFETSRRLTLHPPRHNDSDYGDWVLVLESKQIEK